MGARCSRARCRRGANIKDPAPTIASEANVSNISIRNDISLNVALEISMREHLMSNRGIIENQEEIIWNHRSLTNHSDAHQQTAMRLQHMKQLNEFQLASSELWECEFCLTKNQPIFIQCRWCGGVMPISGTVVDPEHVVLEYVQFKGNDL